SLCCCGQGRVGPVGAEDRDGGRATPSDAPTTRSCACHGAWNGRAAEEPGIGATRTPDMTSLAPLPFWVRGAAREGCSWLVWLGGECDRWRRLRCRRPRAVCGQQA